MKEWKTILDYMFKLNLIIMLVEVSNTSQCKIHFIIYKDSNYILTDWGGEIVSTKPIGLFLRLSLEDYMYYQYYSDFSEQFLSFDDGTQNSVIGSIFVFAVIVSHNKKRTQSFFPQPGNCSYF